MVSSHAALAAFLVVAVVWGASVGAYWGVARARAPLGAPESHEIVERRLRFKEAHVGEAKAILIAASVLLVAAVAVLIVVSL